MKLSLHSALAVLALVLACPARAFAQGRSLNGVKPLAVRVHVLTASISGDTTALAWTVENRATGGEDFWALLVVASARVVGKPAADSLSWVTRPRYKGKKVAEWMLNEEELLHPGQSSPALRLVAVGIPDTVRYWAVPDLLENPAVYDPTVPDQDEFMTSSDSGVTVGVVPVPVGATPRILAGRLGRLVSYACGSSAWIAHPGTCQSLRAKVVEAQRAFARGTIEAGAGALRAFVNELDAQDCATPSSSAGDAACTAGKAGAFVTTEAYALLRPNAVYLLNHF